MVKKDTFPKVMSLTLPITLRVTPEQFWHICQANPDALLELSAAGVIETMSPTGWQSGQRNASITTQLGIWVMQTGQGVAFDSSTRFRLPDGAVRSPDAAWVSPEKMKQVSRTDADQFFPGCPDFVIELASASDDVKTLRRKMQQYQDNGTEVGWLIILDQRQVEVWRHGETIEILDMPQRLVVGSLMPGFICDLVACI